MAGANPVGSKYDVNLPVTRNIDLPPTLISRFDLLYLVLDQVDENLDRKLAQHLVGLYLEDTPFSSSQECLVCGNQKSLPERQLIELNSSLCMNYQRISTMLDHASTQ